MCMVVFLIYFVTLYIEKAKFLSTNEMVAGDPLSPFRDPLSYICIHVCRPDANISV